MNSKEHFPDSNSSSSNSAQISSNEAKSKLLIQILHSFLEHESSTLSTFVTVKASAFHVEKRSIEANPMTALSICEAIRVNVSNLLRDGGAF